jgi:hypothetical protein
MKMEREYFVMPTHKGKEPMSGFLRAKARRPADVMSWNLGYANTDDKPSDGEFYLFLEPNNSSR